MTLFVNICSNLIQIAQSIIIIHIEREGADLALRPPEKILTCLPPNIELPVLSQ